MFRKDGAVRRAGAGAVNYLICRVVAVDGWRCFIKSIAGALQLRGGCGIAKTGVKYTEPWESLKPGMGRLNDRSQK